MVSVYYARVTWAGPRGMRLAEVACPLYVAEVAYPLYSRGRMVVRPPSLRCLTRTTISIRLCQNSQGRPPLARCWHQLVGLPHSSSWAAVPADSRTSSRRQRPTTREVQSKGGVNAEPVVGLVVHRAARRRAPGMSGLFASAVRGNNICRHRRSRDCLRTSAFGCAAPWPKRACRQAATSPSSTVETRFDG